MPQSRTSPIQTRTLLLLPSHVQTTPSTLPLLQHIQHLLNTSYTATYCAHPSLFGTEHVRLADPAQLSDIISPDGFTVVLLRVREANSQHGDAESSTPAVEVVATGSVKNFGSGDVESYATWSTNVSGTQWAAKAEKAKGGGGDGNEHCGEGNARGGALGDGKGGNVVAMEITAFAVSPDYQGLGLGARVLAEIEWLVSAFGLGSRHPTTRKQSLIHVGEEPPTFEGASLSITVLGQGGPIVGIDVDKLRNSCQRDVDHPVAEEQGVVDPGLQKKTQKLVLMGIRELGNEEYYKRRGFSSVWAGGIPVGMWDCLEECTMVYMEKELPARKA